MKYANIQRAATMGRCKKTVFNREIASTYYFIGGTHNVQVNFRDEDKG